MSGKFALISTILTALIGAFATAYFGSWFGFGPNFLEFKRDVRAPFIAFTDDLNQRLAITHRGQPLQALSAVDVDIFNHAGKDAQNITLIFNLKPIDASQSFKLLEVYMIGPKVLGDVGIDRLPEPEPEKRVVFKVTNLKQTTDKREYLYTVRFLFEGTVVPEITPTTSSANWEFEDYVDRDIRLQQILAILYVLIVIALTFLWAYHKTKKERDRFAEKLRSHLHANSSTTGLSHVQIDQIIASYFDLNPLSPGWFGKNSPQIRVLIKKNAETLE